MAGTIRARGKCPKCKKAFTEIPGLGFICPDHETTPKRCYVDLPWEGKRIRIYTDKSGQVLDTYERAERVRNTIQSEIEAHVFDAEKYVKAEAMKFWAMNLLDRYEKDRIENMAPGYQGNFKRMIRIARDFFKSQDVREIRKIHLINYVNHCRSTFTWKDKTLKNTLDVFHAFMGYLKNDLEVIDTLPVFPKISVQEPGFRWLGSKDQKALFEKVKDEDKPIIAFLMLHGCRPGEARALKCKDINLENESITIAATFSRNVYREKRKGKRAKHVEIPIHPEMFGYLKERVRSSLPEAFVFINPRSGGPYSRNKMERIWAKVKEDAGIGKELRLYDATRHSYASQLVNSGVSLFKVSRLLGHSNTRTTERYSHTSLDGLRVELRRVSLGTVSGLSLADDAEEKK